MVDEVIECVAKAFHEVFAGARNPVGEVVGLESEPEPLDGIEVGTVGREEQGLKVMPLETFGLVPGGIVEHQEASHSRLGRHAD